MARRLLVLHGPTLGFLDSGSSQKLSILDARIRAHAAALKLEVTIVRSNHEGALVDALEERRQWYDGLIVSPGPLAYTGIVLRQALAEVNVPTIEVHLAKLKKIAGRATSVVKDACDGQVVGPDAYLDALERFATEDLSGKKKKAKAKGLPARPPMTMSLPPPPALPKPTITAPAAPAALRPELTPVERPGARLARQAKSVSPVPPSPAVLKGPVGKLAAVRAPTPSRPHTEADGLTRALVRGKVDLLVKGKLSAGELNAWARRKLNEIQRGAPAESGQREALEEALQNIVSVAVPSSKLTIEQVRELFAPLEA
jgi:3-dehydroquinate dehydratase-2